MRRILSLFVLTALFAAAAFAQNKNYNIGDKGPAGGIVFYDKGEVSDGWRYLEAAPAETEFQAQCGTYGQTVAGTKTEIGFGKQNTAVMVKKLQELGESDCASQLCASLNHGGFKDWFMPSKDELDLMFKTLKENGLGNFKSGKDVYLSSSKAPNKNTWGQVFNNGFQSAYKAGAYNVRAIRAF